MGEQRDRFYSYAEVPLKSQAVRVGNLWHKRMGHSSNEVMKIFAKHLDFPVNENNDMSDTCFRARQTRKKVSQN